MAGQIQQNPDGTYTRTYSGTELSLIKGWHAERDSRIAGDSELWAVTTSLGNRIQAIEEGQFSLSDMQSLISSNVLQIEGQESRIRHLEDSSIIDAYSKGQTDQLAVEWQIEQIAHTFDTPANHMFDNANLEDIRVGYKHYHRADVNEPYDNHIPENTMQRYGISAYAATPKQVTFKINYADRLVIVVDGVVKATYTDTGGNFGQGPKIIAVDLKVGWTKIQFLLANETQAGGLVIVSDLYEKADYLACLDYLSGMITGGRIQPGALDETHFSPNMDMTVHTLHATATEGPGLIVGNADEKGILQIGDGTISKSKDEPFEFSGGIRVNGGIRVAQLLIDQDFIRAGNGMIVKTIKDEYGSTQMYEMINDMRIADGGGINITGDAQKGYVLANDLQLLVHEEGGLSIEGNPINGYLITNTLDLKSLGGIEVTGDAKNGYKLRNTMKLTSDYGIISVTGDADTGYILENTLQIKAGRGIKVDGVVDDGIVTIDNDMHLEGGGDVVVTGDASTGYKVSSTIHVKEVAAANGSFITVNESANGNHQIGVNTPAFEDQVQSVIDENGFDKKIEDAAKAVHVKDVHSEVSWLGITDTDGDHKITIDANAAREYFTSPYMMPAVIPAPNNGMTADITVDPNVPFMFATELTGGTAVCAVLSGIIPAYADAIHVLTQGGWKGSANTSLVELEFRILDQEIPDKKITKKFSRTITSYLDAKVEGVWPGYNSMLHTIKIDPSPRWRHYDAYVKLGKVSGPGNAMGRAREIWTGKFDLVPAHVLEDNVPREFV